MRRALAVLLLSLAVGACSGEADFSDSMPTPVMLSSEKFQPQIQALDRLAFTEGAVDDARRKAMGDAFEDLADRIREGSDSKFLLLESLELRALAAHARHVEAGPAMKAVQENWMRLRSNLFEERGWFARSAADLTAPVPAEPAETTASVAPEKPKAPPVRLRTDGLDGRWALRELYGNGKRMTDEELTGAVWTFDEGLLSMTSPAGSSHYSYSEVHDERGSALHVRESDTPANRPPADGWMLYALEGNRLRVAFFDGLGERPESFARTDGKAEPMLTVSVLERVP